MDDERAALIPALASKVTDWEGLLSTAQTQGMTPLLYWHLNRICPLSIPADALGKLRECFEANVRRNLRLTGELLKVIELFESEGIVVLPFKGPTLAVSAYGNLALRSFTDLDIVILRRDFHRARDLLISRGYQPELFLKGKQEEDFLKSRCELGFTNDQSRCTLDLHWEFTSRFFSFPFDVDSLFERLETTSLGHSRVRTMPVEDMLLILCVQAAKDNRIRLSWVCDIAETLKSSREIHWDLLFDRASKLGARRMLLSSLAFVDDLLGVDRPEEVLRKIKSDRPARGLAHEMKERLFSPGDSLRMIEASLFCLRNRERWIDKVCYCWRAVTTPSILDWQLISLPDSLYFLYFPVHGARIVLKCLRIAFSI